MIINAHNSTNIISTSYICIVYLNEIKILSGSCIQKMNCRLEKETLDTKNLNLQEITH